MNQTETLQSPFEVGVRGIGICSASGINLEEVVSSIRKEHSSLGFLKRNTFILGEFKGGEVPIDVPIENRAKEILRIALTAAMAEAKLTNSEKKRTGIFVGSTSGFHSEAEIVTYEERRRSPDFKMRLTARGAGEVAAFIAKDLGVGGPVLSYSIACTSSAYALLEAWRFLRAGLIDHAVVVGYETLLNTTMHGFKSLMLYDPDTHRPFDKNRKGLQLGEGCGVIVLERLQGKYRFSMVGGASRNDHANITGADLEGESVVKLMHALCETSFVKPSAIVAIKAHGTGTLDNDLSEGKGFKKFFETVPKFSSIKAYMGHTLGAAGALEIGTWLGCLEKGFIPRSIGFDVCDEQMGVQPTKEAFGAEDGNYAMTFFGFGGSSVGLMFKREGKHA